MEQEQEQIKERIVVVKEMIEKLEKIRRESYESLLKMWNCGRELKYLKCGLEEILKEIEKNKKEKL